MGVTSLAAAPELQHREDAPPAKGSEAVSPLRASRLRHYACADLARDAGAAEPAIAEPVLGEILLMVILRIVEFPRALDLGRDLAEPPRLERGLIGIAGGFRGLSLFFARPIDGRAVAGADVVALAHALRRVVGLPEHLEQRVVGNLARIEDDLHRLGMAGQSGAYLLIGWIGRHPADAADCRDPHAGQVPERFLRTPIAAEREICGFAPLRIGALELAPVDEMLIRRRYGCRPAGKRRFRRRHGEFFAVEEHGIGIPLVPPMLGSEAASASHLRSNFGEPVLEPSRPATIVRLPAPDPWI